MNYTIDVIIARIKRFSYASLFYTVALGFLFLIGLGGDGTHASAQAGGPTDINVGTKVKQPSVKRFGINLSGQSFYDSGQMLRNLIFRNPGFEGQMWQSILVCHTVTPNSCTDDNPYNQWPADFLKGAQFEFTYGAAKGQTGTIQSMDAANQNANRGVTFRFSKLDKAPAVGDFFIVRSTTPGNAQAGWWPGTNGGGTLTTEYKDLSPNSPGKQALRMTASQSGQSSGVTSYFDSFAGHSFVQLNGSYTLSFRAKGTGGSNQMSINVGRIGSTHGNVNYIQQTVSLSNDWKDYSFSFNAKEDGTFIGTANVGFSVTGASALLDDVMLNEVQAPDNPTAFRNAVVSRLRDLHPGVIRYMDNGTDFGSSIDNMLAVPFARMRSGYGEETAEQDDIPIGLHEFLVLCQAVGAEPWFTMPAGMTPTEMQNLVQYLGGDSSTPYGKVRTQLGQSSAWTTVFPTIHLELGNELWNQISFSGEKTFDPIATGQRAGLIFGAAKSAPGYDASKFDLVMDSWAGVPWWTGQELSVASNADTVDAAPYLFNNLSDFGSNEAIFGPMFAQPEQVDSTPDGYMAQQAAAAAAGKVKLAVYEVNLSTVQGTASQSTLDSVIPSVGAGIAVVEHMFLMLRDDGIITQNMFALPEYENGFLNNANSGANENIKLWGSVVDMGGQTNNCRPTFLAEQLGNTAMFGDLLETIQTGANPTWNQPKSANDNIALANAHYLQSFAFSDGTNNSVVVFNLHRTSALPVTFSGANAPTGTVTIGQLTSKNITDTNESRNLVSITTSTASGFKSTASTSLPPYSMTVFTWSAKGGPVASQPAPTTAVLNATPTQAATGQTVALTATVAAGSQRPTGTVTFMDGANALGTAQLANGAAIVNTTTLSAGTHTLKVVYAGDQTYEASTSVATTVTIGSTGSSGQAHTSTTLTAPSTKVAVGDKITLNATVAQQIGSEPPTGQVTFYIRHKAAGMVSIAGGKASLSVNAQAAGTYKAIAVYTGDAKHAKSNSGALAIVVTAKAKSKATETAMMSTLGLH